MEQSSERVFPGGWQPTLPNPPNTATADIQAMVAKLKPQLQEKLNMDIGQCQALFYYSQVVAGANYLILLRIDVNTFLYVQVFQAPDVDAVPVLTQCYTPKVFNTTLEVPIGGRK